MPRNIRDRRDPNNRVVHVTNRTWEGLPFVPNRTIRRMVKGILARAQNMSPVTICLFLFMGNHYHMIMAGDANRVSLYLAYVDAEIARRMMRFFPGRWGPKFWAGRFKEQLLATPQDVINKIAYICCNPMRANLVSNLSEYPGASSIASLKVPDHKTADLCSFTFPKYFKPLKTNRLSRSADIDLSKELQEHSSGHFSLETDLFAWTKCFKEKVNKESALQYINATIAIAEKEATARGVIGADALMFQPFDREHTPERKGETPYVECSDKELRKILIKDYQQFRALCAEARRLTRLGLHAEWPRGAFVPARLWSSLVPIPIPLG